MIRVQQSGAVATVAADDYRALTRADVGFATALRDAVRDAADSDTVKAIVIGADGPDFAPAVAPAELLAAAAVRRTRGPAWHAAFASASGLYQSLAFCKKVVVTAVDGRCSGAGSMLVLCSDLTAGASGSTFESPFGAMPEANLVLAALTVRLNRAKGWLLGPKPWTAAEAFAAGLINRVAPAGGALQAAQALAAAAALMPLDGIAMTKVLLEAFLDTQGVGQEFDMASLYSTSMDIHWNAVAPRPSEQEPR